MNQHFAILGSGSWATALAKIVLCKQDRIHWFIRRQEVIDEFVKTGKMTLEHLVNLMCNNPRRRFGITSDAGHTVWNVEKEYCVNPDDFETLGRATPFEGREVFGENLLTVYNGSVVYRTNEEE